MTKMKMLVSISVALALVLALVPTMALAANDSAGGSFTTENNIPEDVAVVLYDTVEEGEVATAMDPQVEYNVKVTVTDDNTMDDLNTVTVTIYWDEDGTYSIGTMPVEGNVNTASILTWTNAGTDTWEIDTTSGGGSWSIVSGSCEVPVDMGASTGTFEFHFIPGAVATETAGSDEWHIYAVADDGTGTDDGYQENLTMNWYGAVAISLDTIAFGSVALGVVDDPSPNFVLTNIANGDYKLNLMAGATWTGDSTSWELSLDTVDENPGDAELALEADDDATEEGAQLVTAEYVLYTGHATDSGPTVETGTGVTTNTLWLSLGSTGIVADNYSGTIYYQILND